MNNNKHKYKLSKAENTYTINDQLNIRWKDLYTFPIPLFIFLCLILILLFKAPIISGISLSLVLALLFGLLYIAFRFSAWLFYKEIVIDTKKKVLKVKSMFLSRTRSVSIITNKYDIQNMEFIEHSRGGQKKYILRYNDYKNHDLLIIDSEESKNELQEFLTTIL